MTDWKEIDNQLDGRFLERFNTPPPSEPFAMQVLRDEWHDPTEPTEHNPDMIPERTVIEYVLTNQPNERTK